MTDAELETRIRVTAEALGRFRQAQEQSDHAELHPLLAKAQRDALYNQVLELNHEHDQLLMERLRRKMRN